MRIPVLIEAIPGDRFQASSGEPFVARLEGDSPEAALARLREHLEKRVASGAQIAEIELSNGENPWLAGAGMFHDEPLFDEWQRAMADYRRSQNDMPDAS